MIDYPEYEIYLVLRKDKVSPKCFTGKIVEHMSVEYLRLLATCEYLINDTSFWEFFHKRPEQKYFIFWHGTPLKYLGKSTQVQGYGNVQRNLAAADKIFVSNKFTKEKLIADFGIKDIVNNQIIVAPSPRNSSLFENRVVKGRYLYMPTWRGKDVSKISVSQQMLRELEKLDQLLSEDIEVYVKLHPYESSLLNFSEQNYRHIKAYPETEELYEFLQTVEQLITDYSSIMFDFAVTNRPVILWTFDEKEYLQERGMYLSLDELPFVKVESSEKLAHVLVNSSKIDYTMIHQEYTYLDEKEGTKIILDYLLQSKLHSSIYAYSNWNGRENVLIYAYQLNDNGITSSLLNTLDRVDLSLRNYILIWQEGMIPPELEYKIRNLPKEMYTFIQTGKVQCTLTEMLNTSLYMQQLPANKESVAGMYRRDFERTFPNLQVTHFIHYPGYDRSYAVWVWALRELGVKTNIFVHTDMEKEFKINPNLKPKIIFEAYKQADHVVCVSRPIEKKILSLVPIAHTMVMEVLINPESVQKIAQKPLDQTIPDELLQDFNNSDITVFVSVGRFSKQKGYDRLISAFEQLNNPHTRLVLICSYGPEKETINEQINNSSVKTQIYLLENLVQPYNLVKKANVFVFSSRYEGLGMVVFEALAVKTPVIMTDIPETLDVLGDREKAIVVENSTEGLLKGMQKYLTEGSKSVAFDFKEKEMKSVKAWESLFRNN
jgi:CDP-glycerol glycerophosphotransferase